MFRELSAGPWTLNNFLLLRWLSISMGYFMGWLAAAIQKDSGLGPDFSPVPLQLDLGLSSCKHALCLSRRTYEAMSPRQKAKLAQGPWTVHYHGRPDPQIAHSYARFPTVLRQALTCEDYLTCRKSSMCPHCELPMETFPSSDSSGRAANLP